MINNVPSHFANTITPFAPIGRTAVGEENVDLKASILKPAEQSAESAQGRNRRFPDERPNEEVELERQLALTREKLLREGRRREEGQGKHKSAEKSKEAEQEQGAEEMPVNKEACQQREEEWPVREEGEPQREQFEAEQGLIGPAARAGRYVHDAVKRNIDINRRLIDLDLFPDKNIIGRFLDKTV